MINEIKQLLSDIFDVPLEQTQELQYGQHKNWDSMRHFLLILALEDLLGKEIDEKTSPKLTSFNKIMEYYNGFLN